MFGALFFPSDDKLFSTMAAFGTFAVGFFARPFDADCVAAVQQAVDALGYAQQSIVSGAGHDAIHLARFCPTAMVFIPCVGGLSHNEAEDVLPEDVGQGTDVLLNAVLARAVKTE